MKRNDTATLRASSPYSAVLTREQFLFFETRTTARLICEGHDREEILKLIARENLFQYPTEKMIKRMIMTCFKRLDALEDPLLVEALATQPSDVSKQICLYAMMKQYRLMWDFMVTVIGAKYRSFDLSFSKMDINAFFLRLQEQDDWVAGWSAATITKLKQVLQRIMIENDYIDSPTADHLNPVMISNCLENAIRSTGQEIALPAFNCLL